MFYTYVLYSKSSKKHYIGSTADLKRRMHEHRRGKTKTTSSMHDLELIYYEACVSRTDAEKRERQLKTGYGRGYLKNRLKESLRAASSVG